MAQVDELRLQNGVWAVYMPTGQWQDLPAPAQEYMNRNFSGVSGTGDNQVFSSIGTADPPMPLDRVRAGIMASLQGTAQPTPSPTVSAGTQGERIRDAYRTWTNKPNAEWPPMKEDVTSPRWEMVNGTRSFTGYNPIQDTEAIKQFLSYAKLNNLRFTDVELPGAAGTPQAVTIGDQQYFQQPGTDGQFERIPQEKAVPAAPAAPSIETHGGIQFINQDGKLVPIDNMMK